MVNADGDNRKIIPGLVKQIQTKKLPPWQTEGKEARACNMPYQVWEWHLCSIDTEFGLYRSGIFRRTNLGPQYQDWGEGEPEGCHKNPHDGDIFCIISLSISFSSFSPVSLPISFYLSMSHLLFNKIHSIDTLWEEQLTAAYGLVCTFIWAETSLIIGPCHIVSHI